MDVASVASVVSPSTSSPSLHGFVCLLRLRRSYWATRGLVGCSQRGSGKAKDEADTAGAIYSEGGEFHQAPRNPRNPQRSIRFDSRWSGEGPMLKCANQKSCREAKKPSKQTQQTQHLSAIALSYQPHPSTLDWTLFPLPPVSPSPLLLLLLFSPLPPFTRCLFVRSTSPGRRHGIRRNPTLSITFTSVGYLEYVRAWVCQTSRPYRSQYFVLDSQPVSHSTYHISGVH